jgi:hypothetical protein
MSENPRRYTVRYRTFEGARIELCVEAGNVTEAIEVVRNEVPTIALHPGRIESVIRGCPS